jgi:hypothetical protein
MSDILIIKTGKYDYIKYNKTFIEKNKDKITVKHQCPICLGKYTYFNKSKHNKSSKHLLHSQREKI